MRIVLAFTIFLSSFSVFAIDQNDIYGTWVFDKLESENLEGGPMDMMTGMFESMTFVFNKDKSYSNEMLGHKELGTYVVNEANLILTSEAQNEQKYDLINLDSQSLVIAYKDMSIFLKKLTKKEAESKKIEMSESEIKLIGKWTFDSVEGLILDGKLPDDAKNNESLTLKKEGDYILKTSNGKEEGKWNVQGKNEFLILKSDENETRLRLVFIDLNTINLESRLKALRYKLSK